MTGVFIRRATFGYRHIEGRRPREDGSREGSDAAVSQRIPRTVSNHQKLKEARKALAPRAVGRNTALMSLDSGLQAPRTAREHISVVASHPVRGTVRAATGNEHTS